MDPAQSRHPPRPRERLGGRAIDPLDEARIGRDPGPAPVLGGGVDAGRDHGSVQVGKQRPHRMVDRQRVAGRPAGCGEERWHLGQPVSLDHVEEQLEEAAVRRVEDRGHGDQSVGATTASISAAGRAQETGQ
jgi:hypothetical protein